MSSTAAPFFINREVDVYIAMACGRDLALKMGFNTIERTKIEIMILELARNILRHAGGNGDLHLTAVEEAMRTGILIVARDDGPGIPDIARAMQDGFSTTGTLGAGLPGVKRLADHFEIDSHLGRGTVVKAWKWNSPPIRGRR